MNKTNTSVLGLLILVGAAYVSAKAYVYFQTKSKVDDAIKQASLFADITYDGISSDLQKGSVSINQISISPRTVHDVIQVRELKMQGDGPMFLFSDTAKMAQQMPEFLEVSMNGLRVSLDGELYSSLGAMAAAQAKAQNIKLPGSCEFGSSLSADDLKALGYDALYANASFSVKNDKIASKTRMSVDMDVEDMGDVSMTMTMRGSNSPMMMAMAPSVDEVRFVYSVDQEYMKGVNKYCSNLLKVSEQQYVDSIVNASDEDYQRFYGFIPGEGIRQAIRSFLLTPAEVDVRMRPSPDINPATIKQYQPQDIVSLLGVNLYVNGEPVQDLSFTVDEKYSSLFGNKGNAEGDADAEERKKIQASYEFQDTALSQLPQYIGAQVIVTTRDGKERQGALVSINQRTAQIEQRIHSGKFSVHVPVDQISKLQVHRLKQQIN